MHATSVPVASAPSIAAEAPRPAAHMQREMQGLHNLVEFHPGFISGSAPEGKVAFQSLAGLGIKTIISVDGAVPEVELAKSEGIRYIHLPIGYNGFDEARRRQLVRATRDAITQGPVYIHCHHGKHRSPAAAAVIAAGLDWITPDQGVELMRNAGTAATYRGLYECARRSTVLAAAEIDETPGEFAAVWAPSSFVKGMLDVDAAFDNLKQIEAAGWMTPKDHPDLVPVAEAGRLADLYRVLRQGEYAANRGAEFGKLLLAAETDSSALEQMLTGDARNIAELSNRFRAITANCKNCHTQFRD